MAPSTAESSRKTLCIGMSVYDDYDGVYFSAMAVRLYHPEIAGETEILVVDNHPDGPCAAELQSLESSIPGYRYLPFDANYGTAVRDLIFREANADFVLCIDCHVMFAPGSLRQLLDYLRAHPETNDLLQGPLVHDDLRTLATHMDRKWAHGMYGVWGDDPRAADPAAPPFEIAMHGLGAFACRKAAWPGFNPRLRGFGGEEGYIHEKFRRAGGRTLCLPFLRWVHRFGRPAGVPYKNSWEDRIWNYLVIAGELGNDSSEALDHFRDFVGVEAAETIIADALEEIASPFYFFDAIYCIHLDHETEGSEEISCAFARLGIANRVRRVEAIATPRNPHIGYALSHRAAVAEARRQGLNNVLVLEDDVLFTDDALPRLRAALEELNGRSWQLLYLGACRWNEEFPLAEGAAHLALAGAVTCCLAIAYHASIYDRILTDVPSGEAEMEQWLRTYHGIDQYYAFSITSGKYLLSPVIATRPEILEMENEEVKRRIAGGARASGATA